MYVQLVCASTLAYGRYQKQLGAYASKARASLITSIPHSVLNLAGLQRAARLRPIVQAQPNPRLPLVHLVGVGGMRRNNLLGRRHYAKLGGGGSSQRGRHGA